VAPWAQEVVVQSVFKDLVAAQPARSEAPVELVRLGLKVLKVGLPVQFADRAVAVPRALSDPMAAPSVGFADPVAEAPSVPSDRTGVRQGQSADREEPALRESEGLVETPPVPFGAREAVASPV
jgi:hypothetical protein